MTYGATAVSTTSSSTASSGDARVHDGKHPNVKHPAYDRMQTLRDKCRAVWGGTETVREMGTTLLPMLVGESDAGYAFRLQLAAVDNWVALAVEASTGLLVEKEPVFGEDMPKTLQELWESFDDLGRHGSVVSQQLLDDAQLDGFAGLLAEHDRIEERKDKAQAKREGLRPYVVLVQADEVWFAVEARGVWVLLILHEVVEEPLGDFGLHSVHQWRVYRRKGDVVTVDVWKAESAGGTPAPDGQSITLGIDEIPWSPLVAGKPGDAKSRVLLNTAPAVIDLVNLVLQYHQTQTNILYLEHVAMVPQQVRIGAPRDKDGNYPPLERSPNGVIEAPYPPPDVTAPPKPVYWDSPDVSVLEPAQKTLERTERAIRRVAGAYMSTDEKRAAESGVKKRMDHTADRARLSTLARRYQDCLETTFRHLGKFANQVAGSVIVNRDFEAALMEANVIMAYVALVKSGYPKILALKALQAGGRIGIDEDLEQIALDWEAELQAELARQRIEAKELADEQNLPEETGDE